MSSLMISKQCLGWQWCIWTFLKTLALNTIHTQYTHTHTHTHTVFYHACRGWGWIHSCLYNKEPISASTPSSNHTRRARDWPLRETNQSQEQWERHLSIRSHGTEIIASALTALTESLRLLANYQSIAINTS